MLLDARLWKEWDGAENVLVEHVRHLAAMQCCFATVEDVLDSLFTSLVHERGSLEPSTDDGQKGTFPRDSRQDVGF